MQQKLLAKLFSTLVCVSVLQACGSSQHTTENDPLNADKREALRTLQTTIKPATNAVVMFSTDIDWSVGVLPWDRFTLPIISPDGTHAAVQLGPSVPSTVLAGTDRVNLSHTVIELHHLDPVRGKRNPPIVVDQKGLILGRNSNNVALLVEAPRGNSGRWIGRIDWATGQLRWLVSDDATNAFPTLNGRGDLAWSRRSQDATRFQLVVKTGRKERIIDDGESDWLLPTFAKVDNLHVYRLKGGALSLVHLDLNARDPLLTSTSLLLMETGATREQTWQIATTNPTNPYGKLAFYHPIHHRMTVRQPGESLETVYLVRGSVAAAPVADGSWIVATSDKVIRQQLGTDDGIHLRDQLAVPIATTSDKWTHLMLVPDGNRLQVRAINLDQ